MSYADGMNYTECPACGLHYTTQDKCPACAHRDEVKHIAPQQVKKGANSSLSVVGAVKPPKPTSWTDTSIELPVPIMRKGAEIWYVRHFKTSVKKGKDYDRFYYDGHWHSILELWFWAEWQRTGYPMPTPEYKFHPDRKWKLDFAWADESIKIAVEMEGGAHGRGRHTRGVGFKKDIEKYNEATALGWQLYRFADTKQENIEFMKARFDAIDELAKAG